MENELKNINDIIRRIAYAYSLISLQCEAMNRNSESLKSLLKGIKNEFYEVNINDNRCYPIIQAIDTNNLSECMENIDVSIGMLMKLKNQNENNNENKIIDVRDNFILDVDNNNDLGVCGAICINGDTITLYVRPSTGQILYYDKLSSSNKVISGLILKDAVTVVDDKLVSRNLLGNKYGEGAIGIIFCNNYAMVINSNCSAEKRNLDTISTHTTEFILIDINLD